MKTIYSTAEVSHLAHLIRTALRSGGAILACLALASGSLAQEDDSAPGNEPGGEDAPAVESAATQDSPETDTPPLDIEEPASAVGGEGDAGAAHLERSQPSEQRELSAGAAALAEEIPKFVPAEDPVETYLEAIENVETLGGAYAVELSDLYLGLGKALLDSQEFDQARNAFHQGVMVVRVNSGPNSTEQTNYMFSIADVETFVGDWPAAIEIMDNIYFINARQFGEDNTAMLPVLDKMYRWYLNKRPLNSGFAQYADFQRAEFLAGRMAYLTEKGQGLGHPETARIYRSLGQMNFLTIRYILSKGFEVEPGIVMSSGGPAPPFMEEVSVRDHYIEGRNAFERVIHSVNENPDATPLERAEALAQFGDWHLVFKKYQTARDWYYKAYEVLAIDESTRHLADEYMGDPSPVRFMMSQRDIDFSDEGVAGASLDVNMTVTKTGDLRKIKILNAPDNMSPALLKEIENQLEDTRFRPGFVNGEVKQVEGFVWHYSLGQPVGLP